MAYSPDEAPLMGQGLTWESMTAGSSFRTAARTITESDLMSFVHVAGFNEPPFYDVSHAGAGGYTGRLVPGALVYVLAEGLMRPASGVEQRLSDQPVPGSRDGPDTAAGRTPGRPARS